MDTKKLSLVMSENCLKPSLNEYLKLISSMDELIEEDLNNQYWQKYQISFDKNHLLVFYMDTNKIVPFKYKNKFYKYCITPIDEILANELGISITQKYKGLSRYSLSLTYESYRNEKFINPNLIWVTAKYMKERLRKDHLYGNFSAILDFKLNIISCDFYHDRNNKLPFSDLKGAKIFIDKLLYMRGDYYPSIEEDCLNKHQVKIKSMSFNVEKNLLSFLDIDKFETDTFNSEEIDKINKVKLQ